MTNLNNPFLVPGRQSVAGDDRRYEAKSTRAWISTLPMGDTLETGHEIAQRLLAMNQVNGPPRERVQTLEIMLTPLRFVFDELSEKVFKSPLPLSKHQSEQLKLADSLRILLIHGYKSALEQFHHDSGIRRTLNRHARILAAHRVLYLLDRLILSAYKLYQTPAAFTWRELHGIYRYTHEQRFHNKIITGQEQGVAVKSSCSDLYKQALLLSIANPYRLQRNEVDLLTKMLPEWASLCRLRTLNETPCQRGMFLIDVGADSPPRYRDELDDRLLTKGWILDTTPLSKVLSRIEKDTASEAPAADGRVNGKPSHYLLSKLMLAWGIRAERCKVRTSGRGEVNVVRGVESVVERLRVRSGLDPVAVSERESTPLELSPVELHRMGLKGSRHPIVQSFDYPELSDRDNPGNFMINRQLNVQRHGDTHSCTVCNESKLGFHLQQRDGYGWSVSVGDLIGTETADTEVDKPSWHLGIVRWIRTDDQNRVDFGVQILEGVPQPVLLEPLDRDNQIEEPLPGLLLFGENGRPTLLISRQYGKEQKRFSLFRNEIRLYIAVGHTIESTGSFSQFSFRVLGTSTGMDRTPPEMKRESDHSGEPEEIDFEQIWR